MTVVPRVLNDAICRAAPRSDLVPARMNPIFSRNCGRMSFWTCVFSCLAISTLLAAGSAGPLVILQQKYLELRTKFVSELESIAVVCEQEQLVSLATEVRRLKSPHEVLGDIDKLSSRVQPGIPANLPQPENAARIRLRKLQSDYAMNLYSLSRKALKEQHASLAFQLISEVLIHNPDHPQARGLLGYKRVGDEWMTPFAIQKKSKKEVWHDDFGWIESKHVPRYENGERYYNGNWITAQREETIRSDFKNAWKVETEHFLVRTNHSQQKGVRLAVAVEAFHRYFMREFAGFFRTPQQLDKLFTSGTSSNDGSHYEIYYFRKRQEFVDKLANKCPLADKINGLYMPQDRKAYFFHNPDISEDESLETLYHEVTHQLLSESTLKTTAIGNEHDFWVIEGIACYFESFRVAEDGTVSVGDLTHPRIRAAREQVVKKQEQEPLARFTALGMLKFQAGTTPELQKRYAQATGLAHFFLHYQDGVYRDEFIEYLTNIYTPVQRLRGTKTLEEIIGVSYATLDAQYATYFKEMPVTGTTKVSR
ncbi:MAG: DUF1570 domain-containing protein [Planctomycetota bacterium]|nr:MAG: DUF1570 domain-containing protein [Planctomycetota bacterium]